MQEVQKTENLILFRQFIDHPSPVDITAVGECFCDEKYRIDRKNSDIGSLEFVVEGGGTVCIDGKKCRAEKNSVIFLPAGTHQLYYSDKENPWHKQWFIFEGPLADAMTAQYLTAGQYVYSMERAAPYFETMLRKAENFGGNYRRFCSEGTGLLLKILLLLYYDLAAEKRSLPQRIKDELDFMADKPYSLDMLCGQLNYSKNYIIRVFEKEFSLTPYQYYLGKRLATAKQYLLFSDDTVGEIADRLSFRDPQYFSAFFKRFTGVSPRDFRKQNQESS